MKPEPPSHNATLIDQTSDRAFWKVRHGSRSIWVIAHLDGVVDREAPLVSGYAGNYQKARDGKKAWAMVKNRTASFAKAAISEKYKHIDFKPPESVANAAKKGLEYRRKASPSNRGGLTTEEAGEAGIGSGVQRATNLKNRDEMSPETVKQMHAFFSRHEKNKSISEENKGEPWNDKGYVAWLLWGGDPGQSWASKIIKQMEAADEKEKKKSASRVAARWLRRSSW